MVSSLEQVAAEAMALSFEERLKLIDLLLESGPPDMEAPLSDAWMIEIKRRIQEIDEGAETYPAEEVFAELREELRRKTA